MADERNTYRVDAYQDSPEWDTHDRWWQMPQASLNRLHIAAYEIRAEDPPTENMSAIRELRELHPDAVLVY